MKSTVVATLLLLMSWHAPAARPEPLPKETLSLTAAPRLTRYAEGTPLTVGLTFKNVGKKRTTFVLPYIERDPPGYIQVRVWDAGGRLVTKNSTLEDGWWTSWVLWSGSNKERVSDRVSLKPGEEYARTIDLARLLAGCDGLPEGLRAGDYRLQFSYGKVVSNEIEISVGK